MSSVSMVVGVDIWITLGAKDLPVCYDTEYSIKVNCVFYFVALTLKGPSGLQQTTFMNFLSLFSRENKT